MLEKIKIKNFVLIEEAELNFSNDLNILIGETGGGKSLVFRAISQIFGKRAQKSYIKEGEDAYEISAELTNSNTIVKRLEEEDIPVLDKLYVKRKFNRNSQNKIVVNGEIVSLTRLEKIMQGIAEITMQNEYQKVTSADYFTLFNPSTSIHQQYLNDLEIFESTQTKYLELEALKDNAEEEALINNHRIKELQIVKEISDPEELQLQIADFTNKMQHLEVYQSTNMMVEKMQETLEIDRNLSGSIAEQLYEIQEKLSDVSFMLSSQLNSEISEADFNQMQEQFSAYKRIERKYNLDFMQFKDYLTELELKQEQLSSLDLDLTLSSEKMNAAKIKLEKSAEKLSQELKQSATNTQKQITKMLTAVGLEQAKIKFEFRELTNYRKTGKDEIKLLIDVNKQNSFGDVNTTLSGGEFARLLLVLKVLKPEKVESSLLLFDEIDTGISGQVAQKIAKLIKSLSEQNQIILITHLAQTAASSDKLFKVSKINGVSKSQELTIDEHYLEIAKLLSGSQVTTEAKAQAKKLIEEVK